jgi:serine/threonine protein kinase
VLREEFAHDGDRLARFEREARTLASLNHPGIAQLCGVEKSPGVYALVMELVDGVDLSKSSLRHVQGRPEQGRGTSRGEAARGGGAPRAMSIEDALPIARQIAEALRAAHEQGIIHRDLKPGNVRSEPTARCTRWPACPRLFGQ